MIQVRIRVRYSTVAYTAILVLVATFYVATALAQTGRNQPNDTALPSSPTPTPSPTSDLQAGNESSNPWHEEWRNISQIGVAGIALLLFFGNELRSWFTQDGISLSRAGAAVFFKLFGAWPVKVEASKGLYMALTAEQDESPNPHIVMAGQLRMKVRTPHSVIFQHLEMVYAKNEVLIMKIKADKYENAEDYHTHVTNVACNLEAESVYLPIGIPKDITKDIDRVVFTVDAGGRSCKTPPIKVNWIPIDDWGRVPFD